MRIVTCFTLLAAAMLLSSCTSTGDGSSFRDGLSDFGSSVGGGIGGDTYGTNRRMDGRDGAVELP